MNVDVIFEFASVFNIERFNVAKGQTFSLYTDSTALVKWFSDNDAALEIVENDTSVAVKALANGAVTILIMSAELQTLKKLEINVFEEIVPPATDLGLTAGDAEPK